jgi:alpha,alpha-trehalase
MKIRVTIGLIVALVIATAAAGQDKTPSQLYGQLFEDVQMQSVFPDGKTFVDAVPHEAPAIVMQRYRDERGTPGFDVAAFVRRNFSVQRSKVSAYRSTPGEDVCTHIDNLWHVLERKPDDATAYSSLLPLPRSSQAGASTRSTIGIPTSPCWGWTRAASTISRSAWSIISRA